MGLFRKPLLEWREPLMVARAHSILPDIARGVLVCGAGLLATGIAFLMSSFAGRGGDILYSNAAAVFMTLSMPVLAVALLLRRYRAKAALYPRDVRGALSGPLPVRAAIVRHPSCPSCRALMTMSATGDRSYVGIPKRLTDGEILEAWEQSDRAETPLEAGVWRTEAAVPETRDKLLFEWPAVPPYWPTKRQPHPPLLVWTAMLIAAVPPAMTIAAIATSRSYRYPDMLSIFVEFIGTCLMSATFAFGAAAAVSALARLAGRQWGWDDSLVAVMERALWFRRWSGSAASFPWRYVKAVTVDVFAYDKGGVNIGVEYEFVSGLACYTFETMSRFFDYDGFVRAVSSRTDEGTVTTETPEGVTMTITGFARKAAREASAPVADERGAA
jgi:hypothetical protein